MASAFHGASAHLAALAHLVAGVTMHDADIVRAKRLSS